MVDELFSLTTTVTTVGSTQKQEEKQIDNRTYIVLTPKPKRQPRCSTVPRGDDPSSLPLWEGQMEKGANCTWYHRPDAGRGVVDAAWQRWAVMGRGDEALEDG